jgi:K+-transporting ATPase KdpF subunit
VADGGNGPVFRCNRRDCSRLRPADGDKAMIENILLSIVSILVLVYLFVALIKPEVF